ncbi:MAG: glycosyltransferase [bacterium]|nr:glycosyltransferase [bacterium]
MEPLISVIVPAYNRRHFILETLESVYHQTHKSIELIIVDDGSSDGTVSIVRSWLEQKRIRFSNVVFEVFEVNKGKSAAVNFGFKVFKGDYLMILDSDDVLIEDALKKEVEFFTRHADVDAICAGAYCIGPSGKINRPFHPFKEIDMFMDINEYYGDLLLKGNAIVSSTVLIKRNVVHSVGGLRHELRYTHDWNYWIRVARKFRFGYVNIPVLYYRTEHIGASSSNYIGTFLEIVQLLAQQKHLYQHKKILFAYFGYIKYYLWLSKNHGEYYQMLKIGLAGVVNSFRFIF